MATIHQEDFISCCHPIDFLGAMGTSWN